MARQRLIRWLLVLLVCVAMPAPPLVRAATADARDQAAPSPDVQDVGRRPEPKCGTGRVSLPFLVAGSYKALQLGSSGSVAACLPPPAGGQPAATHTDGRGSAPSASQAPSPIVPVYYRPGELVVKGHNWASAEGQVSEHLTNGSQVHCTLKTT